MHFAISFVSVLPMLPVLFMTSSAATAQPEVEAECLLQSTGQLALKAEQAVPAGRINGLENMCSGGSGCRCVAVRTSSSKTLETCRFECGAYPAFLINEGTGDCGCCRSSTETLTFQFPGFVSYKFVRPDLSGRLNGLCAEGQKCSCQAFSSPVRTFSGGSLSDCGYFCRIWGHTTFRYRADPSSCACCQDDQVRDDPTGTFAAYTILDRPATALGDPHITTLDGHHYTLMQQGIFSLWHLSGLEIEFHSGNNLVKAVPVDWQIYTRYAGRQAFTKGLLLVDKSGGAFRQVMELTSEDCLWRARKADGEWTMVKDDEEIWVPDRQDYVTGFQVKKNGAKGYKHVHLNVNTKNGKTDKVVLSTSCKPHHNINLQLVMRQRRDYHFVEGELKVARGSRGFSTLQTDSEFAIDAKWQDLGGSDRAASYLDMDQAGDALVATCSREEEEKAQEVCSKHLGHLGDVQHGNPDETFYEDCVYDVCHGAGETAAELAAELRASTQAIEGI